MFKEDVIDVDYGIHVVFSTVPNQEEIEFEKDIEGYYFDNYRAAIESVSYPFLYNPLKFYMLGDYDVCYVSLINNFKFAHRLFEPKTDTTANHIYDSHTFQSYSGFALNDKEFLKETFSKTQEHYFVGIIHLKLNNGLYIGNGISYIESVAEHIATVLDVPYILSQTFSWFELSLIVFIDNPNELTDVLLKLRSSNFSHLPADTFESLYENCLYNKTLEETAIKKAQIGQASLFADTNTRFGFNSRLINDNEKDKKYVADFITEAEKIKLKTEIEWQVKPGHIASLITILNDHPNLGTYFHLEKLKAGNTANLVLGKCDYMIQESENSILSNFYLTRDINRKGNCQLFKHVRKVRTYIFLEPTFDDIIKANSKDETIDPINWEDILNTLAVDSKTFSGIDSNLKHLKISRQIRTKILKIFSNYNNGILDPILFPYFLDFKIFINILIELIDYEKEQSTKMSFPLAELEEKLNKYIMVFEEAYNVRFLNGYQFESISDFDLDFNNSIQQLLSSYGSLVHEYGKLFYDKNYAPIIQLNNIDTVSNYLTIHYFGHHLTSPEFIFASLTKEILNHVKIDDKKYFKLLQEYEKKIGDLKDYINESYFDEMLEAEMIDINYFVIDAIRYKLTYNGKIKIFNHWFWSYNFQNSYLYDSSGIFNEQRLRMEMFRVLLIARIYEENKDYEIDCPTPEIYTYWIRHYDKIKQIVDGIVSYSRENRNNVLYRIYKNVEEIYKLTVKPGKELLPIKQFESIFSDTLISHYRSNNGDVTLLKRDWEDGAALTQHSSLYDDTLYAIDQTGGVFFSDVDKMQTYFKENSTCLQQIINFASIYKCEFIIAQSNKKND